MDSFNNMVIQRYCKITEFVLKEIKLLGISTKSKTGSEAKMIPQMPTIKSRVAKFPSAKRFK